MASSPAWSNSSPSDPSPSPSFGADVETSSAISSTRSHQPYQNWVTRQVRKDERESRKREMVCKGEGIILGSTVGSERGNNVAHNPRSTINSIVIVLTVTSGLMISVANTTSTAISSPTIQNEMELNHAQLQWIISAYPLSSGCLFLACGRLADLYGRKRLFLLGSAILSIFTLACGFAPNVVALDILRAIQGTGAAAIIPASLGILAQSFPPSNARSLAFATFSAGQPLGSVFGLAVGGLLIQFSRYKWRASFYLLAGMNVLCFAGALFAVDGDLPSKEIDRRVDWLGAFLVTSGLVLIIFVLSQGEIAENGWSTPYIIISLIVGLVLIAAFLFWQHRLEVRRHDLGDRGREEAPPPPLMKLSIWTRANGRFAAMMLIAFTNWCGFMSWSFWAQFYYQKYLGLSPLSTVLRLLPMFVSGILCNIFIGLMAARMPLVWIIAIGTSSTMTASLLFALIVPSQPYWAFGFPAAMLSVIGADFVFSAGTLFISKFALPHEQSVAGALFNTMTQLGTAVGITVTTVVYNRAEKQTPIGSNQIGPHRAAHWAAVAFGVIATILAVVFFRGVGVVGEPKAIPALESLSENDHQHGMGIPDGSSVSGSESTIISLGEIRDSK